MKKNSTQETRKSSVSQWEKLRFEIHRHVSKDCNASKINKDTQDTDAVIDIFLSYALALEVISQAYVDAASRIADQDMHEKMLRSIREDKNFIAAYKESMGQSMASNYMVPLEKVKFMMKGAEA